MCTITGVGYQCIGATGTADNTVRPIHCTGILMHLPASCAINTDSDHNAIADTYFT